MKKQEAINKISMKSGIIPGFIEIKGTKKSKYLTLHMFFNHTWVNIYPVLYFTSFSDVVTRFNLDGTKRVNYWKGLKNDNKQNHPAAKAGKGISNTNRYFIKYS